jgi:hypothetical protein
VLARIIVWAVAAALVYHVAIIGRAPGRRDLIGIQQIKDVFEQAAAAIDRM